VAAGGASATAAESAILRVATRPVGNTPALGGLRLHDGMWSHVAVAMRPHGVRLLINGKPYGAWTNWPAGAHFGGRRRATVRRPRSGVDGAVAVAAGAGAGARRRAPPPLRTTGHRRGAACHRPTTAPPPRHHRATCWVRRGARTGATPHAQTTALQ